MGGGRGMVGEREGMRVELGWRRSVSGDATGRTEEKKNKVTCGQLIPSNKSTRQRLSI